MFSFTKKQNGFTLIELLVVISIISLLASVVLTTLNSAKDKAKDAVIRAEVAEFQKLLMLEHINTGSYCGLMNPNGDGFWAQQNNDSCEDDWDIFKPTFTGSYGGQALAICNKIMQNVNKTDPYFTLPFYLGAYVDGVSFDCEHNYAVGALLNNGKLLCASNNTKNEYTSTEEGAGFTLEDEGCAYNP